VVAARLTSSNESAFEDSIDFVTKPVRGIPLFGRQSLTTEALSRDEN
jgi:hypothetical protein